ncbi:MAG: hypothetical protein VX278_11160 [Myxococcota bacterium]|nr:hypothetical protein [Myxococcota bacterium]
MSLILSNSRNFQLDDLKLDILSIGGHYTCVQFPQYKIAIDMGICPQSALRADTVFFTHPHPDHMSGVIYHLSTREMMSQKKRSTYVLGVEHVEAFTQMIESWRKLSKNDLKCTIVPMSIQKEYDVRKDLRVQSFRSVHRIPCQGYTLIRRKKKRKEEYKNYSGPEMAAARKRGEEISREVTERLCSFTGDTSHHVFAQQPAILESKVLVTEVTFFCDRVSPEKATRNGHLHLQDLRRYESMFQNEYIVIMHLSARYATKEVERWIENTLPKHLRERILVVPNERLL